MSKISAIKTEKEELYYKYCYGKWIKLGVIQTEHKKKPSTN